MSGPHRCIIIQLSVVAQIERSKYGTPSLASACTRFMGIRRPYVACIYTAISKYCTVAWAKCLIGVGARLYNKSLFLSFFVSFRVVSGSRDATLRVWDVETGECLHVLVGHVAAVRCVQYDGRLVVSGAYDYTVKVWDPEREECLHTLQGHTNRVYSLQVSAIQCPLPHSCLTAH